MLDELDHVMPTSQTLGPLFSLPQAVPGKLCIIGIANTHTLTSSSSTTSAIDASRNVQTLHFAPYTSSELLNILHCRLRPLFDNESDEKSAAAKKFLPPAPLSLLTKKIATVTGDVRSLFEVLRGAIDLAVAAAASSDNENPLNTPPPVVTPANILAAHKAYAPSSICPSPSKAGVPVRSASTVNASSSTSEIVAKVSNLGLQARLALLVIILASRRMEAGISLGSSKMSPTKKTPSSPVKRSLTSMSARAEAVSIDPVQLHAYYSAVLDRSDRGVIEPVSRNEFADLLGILEGVGLVLLEGSVISTGAGARRVFGRSASFAGGGSGRGKSKGQVKIANGVRTDEV